MATDDLISALDVKTIWDLVEARAAATPDKNMLTDEAERTLTFEEFRDLAERVAAGLQDMGIGEGTRVSWQLPTRITTIVLSMALSRLGAVQNPIIHLYREREVGFALRQTEADHFFVAGDFRGFDFPGFAERVTADLPTKPEIHVIEAGLEDALPLGDPSKLPPPPPALSADETPVRWIYYTSGSTADPKGVMHTDQTLLAGAWGLVMAGGMEPDDVGSVAFPYAHIGGPDYIISVLCKGTPSVLVEAFDLPKVLPFYRKHKVTTAGGSTAFYIAFLTEQRKSPDEPILPTLRMLSGGGAPKPPELHFEVQRELNCRGVLHGLGMTEVPMIAMGTPDDTDEQLAYTDGAPVVGAELKIVTLEGNPAGSNEEGEIRVKGPMVFRGYTDPELTKAAFDDQGYFRTGDLGKIREDGHLCVTGRLKDVIVRKGENISAKEVEDILYTHPKVEDVAVVGLPDKERGERVCAVVQMAAGAEPLTFEEMVAYCKQAGLMTQKIPEQLELRNEMPRAATGKIVKTKLREAYS
jgi:acyl-CoA synthetase (AMP-forming)/AMP-acid ligase II